MKNKIIVLIGIIVLTALNSHAASPAFENFKPGVFSRTGNSVGIAAGATNDSGAVLATTADAGDTANRTVYVRTDGSDVTGAKYKINQPYATIVAANAALVAGDILNVGPGVFSGIITNKSGVKYTFSAGAVWSNASPETLIYLASSSSLDFDGQGDWVSDTVISTTPAGIASMTGYIKAKSITPITTPDISYAGLFQDGTDVVGGATNGALYVNLRVTAEQAKLFCYSHIYPPLAASRATNCVLTFDVDRLRLLMLDEGMTNWTANVNSSDYSVLDSQGGSVNFVVNGGKVILTNAWAFDPVGFTTPSLLLNGPIVIGDQFPPADYYFGTWRTTDGNTNLITKARQFVGINHGSLSFSNFASPQTIAADVAPMAMTNYTRIITNGFYGNQVTGVLTNQNTGVFNAAVYVTGLANAAITYFTVFTNNVATDITGVLPNFGGYLSVSVFGQIEAVENTQWKLVLNGDSVLVGSAGLSIWRIK